MSQAPDPETIYNETTLDDVKQLGLWAALGSLGYVFWIVGGMEMIERLAYYGVRSVSTLYVTRAKSEGGLGETMATFGWLSFTWYLVQMGGRFSPAASRTAMATSRRFSFPPCSSVSVIC